MSKRRHRRRTYTGPVDLSWTDPQGQLKFARGKCLDLSETGLRLESPVPIPVYTSVFLRAERIRLSGAASVRHVTRVGARFALGMELTEPIAEKTLADLDKPPR